MATQPGPPSGAPKFSLALSAAKPKPNGTSLSLNKPKAAQSPAKRPHSLLEPDNDDREDAEEHGAQSQITTFGGDAGSSSSAPRVIAPLADTRAWIGKAKRQKSSLPGQHPTRAPTSEEENDPAAAAPFGLHVPAAPTPPTPATAGATPPPPQTDDEDAEALARLTGQTSGAQAVIRAPSPASEDAAFARAAAAAPPDPTLADYTAVPVEGFGAALMRGYLPAGETLEGWKAASAARRRAGGAPGRLDKDGNMKVERRRDLLGLGAKELDLGDADGRGRGQGKRPSRKQAMEYEPLARRNRVTGAVVPEHEFRAALERREREAVERPRESGGRRGDEDEARERRDRDRERRRERERVDPVRERELERQEQRERNRERQRRRDDHRGDDDRPSRRHRGDDDDDGRERGARRDREHRHGDRSRDARRR